MHPGVAKRDSARITWKERYVRLESAGGYFGLAFHLPLVVPSPSAALCSQGPPVTGPMGSHRSLRPTSRRQEGRALEPSSPRKRGAVSRPTEMPARGCEKWWCPRDYTHAQLPDHFQRSQWPSLEADPP